MTWAQKVTYSIFCEIKILVGLKLLGSENSVIGNDTETAINVVKYDFQSILTCLGWLKDHSFQISAQLEHFNQTEFDVTMNTYCPWHKYRV